MILDNILAKIKRCEFDGELDQLIMEIKSINVYRSTRLGLMYPQRKRELDKIMAAIETRRQEIRAEAQGE